MKKYIFGLFFALLLHTVASSQTKQPALIFKNGDSSNVITRKNMIRVGFLVADNETYAPDLETGYITNRQLKKFKRYYDKNYILDTNSVKNTYKGTFLYSSDSLGDINYKIYAYRGVWDGHSYYANFIAIYYFDDISKPLKVSLGKTFEHVKEITGIKVKTGALPKYYDEYYASDLYFNTLFPAETVVELFGEDTSVRRFFIEGLSVEKTKN